MTANPEVVADGVTGAIGVMCKPVLDGDLVSVIHHAESRRMGTEAPAPSSLRLFASSWRKGKFLAGYPTEATDNTVDVLQEEHFIEHC